MIAYRIWQVAGWTMLHYLWVGGGLGTATLALRWVLRSAAANVRYLAALGGLALDDRRASANRRLRNARPGAAAQQSVANGWD